MQTFDMRIRIRRNPVFFRDGVNEKTIKEYLANLEKYHDWVTREGGWTARHRLFLSEDLHKAISEALRQEIEYCKFYLELQPKMKKPDFDKWVFTPKEKVKPEYTHLETYDQWTRNNGRVEVKVIIDKSKKMVRISFRKKNASGVLKFTDSYEKLNIKDTHVSSPQSISSKIARFQLFGEEFMARHLYPQYAEELACMRLLEEVLCLKEE